MFNKKDKKNKNKPKNSSRSNPRISGTSRSRRYGSSLDLRRPNSYYSSGQNRSRAISDTNNKNNDSLSPKDQKNLKKNIKKASKVQLKRIKKFSKNSAGQFARGPERTIQRRFTLSRIFSGLIAISLLVIVIYSTSLSSSGSVVQMSEDSFSYRPTQEYVDFANSYISSNILARSKLTFPAQDFSDKFAEEFAETTSIDTFIPVGSREVKLKIDTPSPLLKLNSNQGQDTQRLVDRNGGVVEVSGASKIDVAELEIVGGDIVAPGDRVLTQQEVEIFELLETEINSSQIKKLPKKFKASRAVLKISDGRLEVDFEGVEWRAIFSIYSDGRSQVGALKSVLTELYSKSEGQKPASYVDVRVHEKVFVR